MGSDRVNEYKKLEPVNREQRRKLLKSQGWYFQVTYMSWVIQDAWAVYKVYANGKKVLHDDWTKTTNGGL